MLECFCTDDLELDEDNVEDLLDLEVMVDRVLTKRLAKVGLSCRVGGENLI